MSAERGYQAFHDGAAVIDRRDAGVVVVSGPDARSFLEAIVSQSLDGLEAGTGVRSLLLQPTGKMGLAFRLLVIEGVEGAEFWLTCDEGFGGELATALSRYLLRVQCEVADRSPAWGLLSVRGPDAVAVVEASLPIDVPGDQHAHAPFGDGRVVRADWPGVAGVDIVGPVAMLDEVRASLVAGGVVGVVEAGAEAFEAARVEAGVARQGVDLDDSVIPQEAFLDLDAVSFDKGCFLGQELVCRIRDRGRVNRRLRRMTIGGGAVPPVGAEIVPSGNGDGEAKKAVGSLTSVAAVPGSDRVVALGYLRHEVEPGARVQARWDTGQADAEVLGPPPGD